MSMSLLRLIADAVERFRKHQAAAKAAKSTPKQAATTVMALAFERALSRIIEDVATGRAPRPSS
jgi:hypothetical protein